MKKNLRIASAAAAALLAVAPVAASAVSVNAAATPAATNSTGSKTLPAQGTALLGTSNVGATAADPKATGAVSLSDAELQATGHVPTGFSAVNAVVNGFTKNSDGTYTQHITLNLHYNGKEGDAALNGRKLNSEGLVIGFGSNQPATWNLDRVVTGIGQQGTPYFFDKTTGYVVTAGSFSFDNQKSTFTAEELLKALEGKFGYTSNAGKTTVKLLTSSTDVENELVKQGLKKTATDEFNYPASAFVVTLTVETENHTKATLPVTVNANGYNVNYPSFQQGKFVTDANNNKTFVPAGKRLHNGDTFNGNVKVALNSAASAVESAVKNGLVAYVSGNEASTAMVNFTVDSSNVNTAVAGLYTAVVTATNPAGYTSKLNVVVQVGDPAAVYSYVVADGTKVVNINGNVVTETTNTLSKGAQVATYGKVNVNGVEYTRINSLTSNQYVKSSELTATKPAAEVTTTKTIWHVAKIYDKDGKATSEASLHAYNTVSVVSTPVTINGAKYYKLAGKDQYVKAGNIDGTSRTLSHNAYVYKNTGKAKTTKSGKKTKKVVLKKGSQVTTYGSAFTVNGHKMFRIGRNQYVKVANF